MCHGLIAKTPCKRGLFFLKDTARTEERRSTLKHNQYVRPESEESFCLRNVTVQIPMYITEADTKVLIQQNASCCI